MLFLRPLRSYLLISTAFLLSACSTQKNRFVNRQYHRLTTAYNVLFNGEEAFSIGKAILDASVEDNFFELLEVEPIALSGENINNQTLVPGFDRAEEKAVKAIQKHSMRFKGIQRNDQIDKAYILLGKSRYYDRRFFPALEAFNFLLESYGSQKAYLEGIIWREKTNIRLLNNEIAIGNLRPLARQLLQDNPFYGAANATVAQAFINLKELDSAQYYIAEAAAFEQDKEKQGRYHFINGQLLERLGDTQNALAAYQAILELKKKTAHKYRLHAKIKEQFLRSEMEAIEVEENLLGLLRKYDNRAYEHVIYRAIGTYYLRENQDSLAQRYFTASQKAATLDEPTRKANYRDLADYYFKKGAYTQTGSYLDSLIPLLPQKSLPQKQTERERKNLEGILKYENQIKETDSLLYVIGLSKEEQTAFFNDYLEKKKQKIEALVAKNLAQNQKTSLFGLTKESDFYFYQPNLVAQGTQQFQASWGPRPNVDNWRLAEELIVPEQVVTQNEAAPSKAIQVEDVESLIEQLPDLTTLDSLKQLNHQSYLQAGLLYKEQFDNPQLARERLNKVLEKNPAPQIAAPAYYHLFRLEEKKMPDQAAQYKNTLVERYPDSPFSQLLTNPNYQLDSSTSSPEKQYQNLLTAYQKKEYDKVKILAQTLKIVLSASEYAPKIALIMAHVAGQQKGKAVWIEKLKALQKEYPQSPSAVFAGETVEQLEKKSSSSSKTYAIYKWVLPYSREQTKEMTAQKETLLKQVDSSKDLTISLDPYTEDYQFVVVHGFRSPTEIQQFRNQLEAAAIQENSNNFVVLSREYQEIQLYKSWQPYP